MKKSKPDTLLLRNVWQDNKTSLSTKEVELDRLEIDRLISSVFSNGPFYFYILDTTGAGMSLDHVSSMIGDIHGLAPEKVTFQDILDQIHPDDMEFVSRAEAKAFEILVKVPPDRRKNYKVSYCFRFMTRGGSYQLFNHQSIMLTLNDEGFLSKALNIHTNISHLTNTNNHRLSLIGMLGEPSFLNIDVYRDQQLPSPSESIFSRRESEIIRLMSEGLTSQEIANRLSISPNTVKNHRKNILQKSGCKNIGQLITKCITEGLL